MGFYRAIMSLECLSGVFVLVASNDTHKKANEQTKAVVTLKPVRISSLHGSK